MEIGKSTNAFSHECFQCQCLGTAIRDIELADELADLSDELVDSSDELADSLYDPEDSLDVSYSSDASEEFDFSAIAPLEVYGGDNQNLN